MDKKLIRKRILNIRNNISSEVRNTKDKLIYYIFINSDLYKKSKDIFIYVSFGSEVNTHEIIKQAISDKKNVYVPKTNIKKKEMIAVKIYSFDELRVDNYGILEPISVDKERISSDFDIIVMPGVAFDKEGNRIGYGGGYYDKYLEKNIIKSQKVALAYEEQILEKIESDFYDMKVNFIIN
ncbi:MAG: 5-formyltetrahydrofolate cyclo-ligase, partial [Clostridium sp.]|nr:5-formyltetrahydrofolate cyclo-ligase [Clostridium sp.]